MKVDAVILWVDGNDEKWKKEKEKYAIKSNQDAGVNRYRDWGTLKYLFRGIEKYAPWINNVYLVTCGQYPIWLNNEYFKLKCVSHAEFIPNEYLPTFSSQAIDLNLWRIKELSEYFIYFNDDMFLTNYVYEEDFFKNGLPCDMFSERPVFPGNLIFDYNMLNNMKLLMKYYGRKQVLKDNRKKILNMNYGSVFFYNFMWYFLPFKKFCGLYMNHLPMSYRKSEMEKVWKRDTLAFEKTISNKFRTADDLNQFIYNMDALLSGQFSPTNMDEQGKLFTVIDDDNNELYFAIEKHKYKRICINDECIDDKFMSVKKRLLDSFDKILPEKSMFER